MDDTETMARHRDVGAACHRIIANLAQRSHNPSLEQIKQEVRRHLRHLAENEGRAHRQNLTGLTDTYFRELAPGQQWRFHGSEVHLGNGRVDLLWKAADGRLMVDELKTGHWTFFGTREHHEQARRYLHDTRDLFGPHVVGLRLLCLTRPRNSLYLTNPLGQFGPLLPPQQWPSTNRRPQMGHDR
jgi:hypothetical protein